MENTIFSQSQDVTTYSDDFLLSWSNSPVKELPAIAWRSWACFLPFFFLAFCQRRLVQTSKPAVLAASIYQQYQIILLCQIVEWIYKSTMGSRTKDTMLWWNSFRSKALATQVEAVKLETSNWINEHIIYQFIRWRVYNNFSLIFLIYVI